MSAPALPVIDLGQATPSELAEALQTWSCALITGHGVDPALLARMVEVSRQFFDRPEEEKAEVRWDGTGHWRGWLPVYQGADDLNSSQLPELLEKFEIQLPAEGRRTFAQDPSGHDPSGHDPSGQDGWGDGFDRWPAAPVGLRPVWTRYYAELGALADRIVGLLAEAFDLPDEQLADWTDRHFANLVVNDYPAQPEPPAPGQVRIRQHTDIGGLTLLWADDAPGGLEVRLPGSDTWTPVQIPADAFLVQAGELLARWTNDLIAPNVHRVANPPRSSAAESRRTSIVYFHYPDLDVEVTPAPSCVNAERPAAGSMPAGAHLRAAVEQPKARHQRLDAELART
jgi:isopenicillin N synthase-like dioxygenase